MTNSDGRIQRVELKVLDAMRQIRQAFGRLADVEQANRVSQTGTMAGGAGGAGGAYYADPGDVVVDPGGSAELTVWEILGGGDQELGERVVLSRWPVATIPDARLFLIRTRDGAYSITNQACGPPPEEE